MNTASSLADEASLSHGLAALLEPNDEARSGFRVLERTSNVYARTFPSEIVTCQLSCGKQLRVLCKYSSEQLQLSHGHRRGVVFEAEVYRSVLQPLKASVPTCYGACTNGDADCFWLVLEYLDNSVTVDMKPAALVNAAKWIGAFHAAAEPRVDNRWKDLPIWDKEYYLGWVRRTLQYGQPLKDEYPWLAACGDRLIHSVEPLLAAAPTVVHGEFYPLNILECDGAIYPVDWESAATAAGEIDLAALIDGWDAAVVEQCTQAYCETRWPRGAPGEFNRTLLAARIYGHFRWLGEKPKWTVGRGNRRRWRELAETLTQLRAC